MKKSLRQWLILAAATALAACGALAPRLQPPQLSVAGVELVKADLLQQQLRVRMHVHNPNDRALKVRGIEYTVQVAGDDVAHGDSDRDFTVPALGDTEFDVNVYANAAPMLLKYALGGRAESVPYQITGKVQLASGFVRSVPFKQGGELKLR